MNLKVALFWGILTLITCYRFCQYSSQQSPASASNSSSFLEHQLQSYHPQYLHSFSYPQPSTVHVYYGRVQYISPIFLIRQGFESNEKQVFLVNNKNRFLTSAYKQSKNSAKFMLVIAIQDSYQENYTEQARLSLRKEKHIYSISMRNGTEYKAYILYFTPNGSTLDNVSVGVRDASKNPKDNWRLSRQLSWQSGVPEVDILNSSAICVQIDLNTSKNLQIHFKEVQVLNGEGDIHDQIAFLYDRVYYSKRSPKQAETCASAAYNRLIEGLSYQYGNLKVVDGNKPISNSHKPLLSFSPSKKRFPWGFLWDDGFHNEVAVRKDRWIAFKVIKSWLATMIDGWIPRQQNRGKEREQLCDCAPFMAKDIRDGNPPTLILPIQYIIRNRLFSAEEVKQIWEQLKDWYSWYLRTQMAGQGSYLFKWFDHIPGQGSFNSGLDDFPRPQNSKYHIDAQSWMYLMSQVMAHTSKYLNQSVSEYETNAKKIKENLNYFIEPSTSTLRDVGSNFLSTLYSQEVGYPSLLPLAFGMLQLDSKQFNATLNLITNISFMNTSFGLSSISTSSRRYLENKNAYWKGPVWININYLVLRGLKLYYPTKTEVYSNLREDLLKTVCGEWRRTGYFYQNYVNGTGNLNFSYPFNGWTSLIYIISQQNY